MEEILFFEFGELTRETLTAQLLAYEQNATGFVRLKRVPLRYSVEYDQVVLSISFLKQIQALQSSTTKFLSRVVRESDHDVLN